MEPIRLIVPPAEEGARLDKWLSDAASLGRTVVQRLCQEGEVLVNGRPASKNTRLRGGEEVTVRLPEPVLPQAQPQEIPLEIVYEDPYLLVVNKPKGMVVHPAPGNPDGTLVNGLLWHCRGELSGINGVLRPGIVHRIDKDTSGLLIVAKCDQAHLGLAEQIKEHSFSREYEAVVYGHLKEEAGTVDAPIGRHPVDRKKICVTQKNAKPAVTHYQVLEQLEGFDHLRLRLETGRTHQIRVHMAWLGHPVAGDPVYGPKKGIAQLRGQCLHARTIGFVHPITGEWMSFSSPLPAYFTQFLDSCRP